MSVRRSRGTRRPRGRERLTARDILILIAVARMRAATSHQLARLFGMSLSAMHRRLRALAAMGLVTIYVPDLNQPNIVALTLRGRDAVVADGVDPDDVHVARNVVYHDVHAEMINDLRVGLLRAAAGRIDVEIDACLSDWDLRRELGRANAHARYVPDMLAVVRVQGEAVAFAFEVDRGFEPTGEIRKKVRATVELARQGAALYGFRPWRPALFVPTARRLVTLARHIREEGGGRLWACALLDARHEPLGAHYALGSDVPEEGAPRLDHWLVGPP